MNLLLLEPAELTDSGVATLVGRRARHAQEILKLTRGDPLRVGLVGGNVGTAEVLQVSAETLELKVTLSQPPPPRAGLDLILAIPRPKALKKVLPAVASLGVDRIVLVNAARVEKSYFDSNVVEPPHLRELLLLGLEQARDTRLPELLIRERFRPFVEDELDSLFPAPRARLVAHPAPDAHAPTALSPAVVAIGPEGGWVPFELDLLSAQGFRPVSLGPRTLRVETAVPFLFGWLEGRRVLQNRPP
ncbi:MAG: 16S rRNA (uracil(1498)-N(3))-methyltransferase [Myxococcaceae bacterium]